MKKNKNIFLRFRAARQAGSVERLIWAVQGKNETGFKKLMLFLHLFYFSCFTRNHSRSDDVIAGSGCGKARFIIQPSIYTEKSK